MMRRLFVLLLVVPLGGCGSPSEPDLPVAKSPAQVDANPMIPPGAKDAARAAVGNKGAR